MKTALWFSFNNFSLKKKYKHDNAYNSWSWQTFSNKTSQYSYPSQSQIFQNTHQPSSIPAGNTHMFTHPNKFDTLQFISEDVPYNLPGTKIFKTMPLCHHINHVAPYYESNQIKSSIKRNLLINLLCLEGHNNHHFKITIFHLLMITNCHQRKNLTLLSLATL